MNLHEQLRRINRENIINLDTLNYLYARSRCPQRIIEDYETIYTIASEVFDPDQFEIQLYYTHNKNGLDASVPERLEISLALVIKFDDIEIKNSNRNSSKLKDVYVMLTFSHSGELSLEKMYGFRGKLSDIEVNEHYMHSHLRSFTLSCIKGYSVPIYPSEFCVGNGDVKILILRLHTNFERNLFKLFLLQIEPFLSWESLEGTPYMKISNLFRKNANIVELNIDLQHLAVVISRSIDDIIADDRSAFEFDIDRKRYSIILNDGLSTMLLNLFPEYAVYIDSVGNEYLTYEQATADYVDIYKGCNHLHIPFKGKDVFVDVYKADEQTEPERKLHRTALKISKTIINTLINKKLIDYYVNKRQTTIV